MLKLLYFFMIMPILFCSQANIMIDLFSEVSMIEIYNDGQIVEMTEEEQNKFEELFCQSITDARQMPAFGVSLHDMTIEEMKHGIWIKFIFDKTIIKSEMPFDELLIHVQKDCHGFNVIRGNNGRYEGRCYYLDLDGTLDSVYDFLEGLEIKNKSEVDVEIESQEIKETSVVINDDNENDNKEKLKKEGKTENKPSVIEQNSVVNYNEKEISKSQKELLNHLQ